MVRSKVSINCRAITGIVVLLIAALCLTTPIIFYSKILGIYICSRGNIAVRGKGEWLFVRGALEYLLRPAPEKNFETLLKFSQDLKNKGILLIVAPIPNKEEIYPEKLCRFGRIPHDGSYNRWIIRKLKESGVAVVDLLPQYVQAKNTVQIYEPYQAHWQYGAREIAAKAIASKIRTHNIDISAGDSTLWAVKDTIVEGISDLYPIITKGDTISYKVPARMVEYKGEPYRDSVGSEVLIYGDSFVGFQKAYSSHIGAFLSKQLSTPVMSYSTIEGNSRAVATFFKKPGLMKGKKVVVYVFISRSLGVELQQPDGE